jgi:hypothetical protein
MEGPSSLAFPRHLAELRERHAQKASAEPVSIRASQLRRYVVGSSLPTLDVVRRLATVPGVSADKILFGTNELEGVILNHQARRWSSANGVPKNAERN